MPADIIVRFAPSPTGLLHAGNARTAVLNFLFARKAGGKFLLRVDDTDAGRSKPEFEAAIIADLAWLGVLHDLFARQSEREDRYRAAMGRLKSAGRLYPAYETPEELERKRKRAHARGHPPVYDRAALKLGAEERGKLEAQGRRPHWRFLLSQKKVAWNDLIRGHVEIDTHTLSDPVLVREDGRFLYTLPSVVDDIDFSVSHVIRGEDHVTNTAVQIELVEALGARPPEFAHHPLLVGAGGESLSKRLGSLSLQHLRDEGVEPLALVAYLAKIGTSDAIEPRSSLDVLATEFDFSKIGRAPAHFDVAELMTLNGKLLHTLSYDIVRPQLQSIGADLGEEFWDAVKPNLARLSDAAELRRLIEGPIEPRREDPELLEKAASLLPGEPYTEATWNDWTAAIGAATGRKGRALYHPLRLALTGRETGPELKKLFPLIGRRRALARLEGKIA
ncbi:MAG: glutamate--tRNA ligase [Alphaproteobacteria bacterium]